MWPVKFYLQNAYWLWLDWDFGVPSSRLLVHQPVVRGFGSLGGLQSLKELVSRWVWTSTASPRRGTVTAPWSLATCFELLVQNWVWGWHWLTHWLFYPVEIYVWVGYNVLFYRGFPLWFFCSFLRILKQLPLIEEVFELKMNQFKLWMCQAIRLTIYKILDRI